MYMDEWIIESIQFAIFPKVGRIKIVRLFLIIVSIEIIEALPVGIAGIIVHTQSPLANSAGGIACLLHHPGKRESSFRQWHLAAFGIIFKSSQFIITTDIRMTAVLTGHQHAAGRCTYRRTGIMLCKANSFFGKLVKAGSFYFLLTIATQFTVPKIICININDVGFILLRHE